MEKEPVATATLLLVGGNSLEIINGIGRQPGQEHCLIGRQICIQRRKTAIRRRGSILDLGGGIDAGFQVMIALLGRGVTIRLVISNKLRWTATPAGPSRPLVNTEPMPFVPNSSMVSP